KRGVLASSGGPTQSSASLFGSPALNKGNNAFMLANDQRGTGFPRVQGSAADVGAFEQSPAAKVDSVVINGGAAQRSRVTSVTMTFDQAVTLGTAPFTLTRQSDLGTVGLLPRFRAWAILS